MRKSDRHLLIKQIIAEHSVGTQEELLQLLEAQGVTATQATISRDIRDLKLSNSLMRLDKQNLFSFKE